MVDILLPQHLNGPLGGPRQLLVDENIGVVIGNIVIGDVDIVPGQPQDCLLYTSPRSSVG